MLSLPDAVSKAHVPELGRCVPERRRRRPSGGLSTLAWPKRSKAPSMDLSVPPMKPLLTWKRN